VARDAREEGGKKKGRGLPEAALSQESNVLRGRVKREKEEMSGIKSDLPS